MASFGISGRRQRRPLITTHHDQVPDPDQVQDQTATTPVFTRGESVIGERGKDLILTSSRGDVADGDIHIKIGEETVMSIVGQDFSYNIARAEITDDDEEEYEVTIDGAYGVVTVRVELEEGDTLEGLIYNKNLKETSWVNVTCVSESCGTPYCWLGTPQEGKCKFYLRCSGKLAVTQLHFNCVNNI